MNKIRILPLHEVQKIAAGEVVERPANVVKELVENALDAGATSIEIHVNNGGKDLIRVIDNGCGMSSEDALLSIVPHATSKISCVDDLQTIASFGFRGEALASICSVSIVTLRTKQARDEMGTQLIIKNGSTPEQQAIACADGTDISIAQLFENIPARKKFLKPTETELRHIIQLFQSLVLAHQRVHFKLFCDGDLIHNCPACTDLPTRMVQLWNHYFADQLLAINARDEAKKTVLQGLVSNHQFQRYNTSQLFFFVNNRWIKNTSLTKAVMRGYQNVLPPGRYPAAVLFLTIDPTLIDVNIHPRKEEVQFIHERSVELLIQSAVKNCLQEQIPAPSVTQTQPAMSQQPLYNQMPLSEPAQSWQPLWHVSTPTAQVPTAKTAVPETVFEPIAPTIKPEPASLPTAMTEFRFIGTIAKTYLLLEKDDALVIIDQHAAHERILYERFKKRFENAATIPLIFAHTVILPREDIQLLLAHQELLTAYGIQVDERATDRIAIRSVPVDLKNADLSGLITEMVALFHEHAQNLDHLHHELCAQMACKAAVKAGDELTPLQVSHLLQTLTQTDNRLTCPHGRPTMWTITNNELERKFKRAG